MKVKEYEQIYSMIKRNHAELMKEYSATQINISESDKWDYAIPESYTNYQDGFLMQDIESRRGAPIIDHPDFGRLYLRWAVSYFDMADGEREKYLCYDRHGNKYTVTIQAEERMEHGNPSYFRFLPKVKKYTPKRKHRKENEK